MSMMQTQIDRIISFASSDRVIPEEQNSSESAFERKYFCDGYVHLSSGSRQLAGQVKCAFIEEGS